MLCGCLAKSTCTRSSHSSSMWYSACSLVSSVIHMRESRTGGILLALSCKGLSTVPTVSGVTLSTEMRSRKTSLPPEVPRTREDMDSDLLQRMPDCVSQKKHFVYRMRIENDDFKLISFSRKKIQNTITINGAFSTISFTGRFY